VNDTLRDALERGPLDIPLVNEQLQVLAPGAEVNAKATFATMFGPVQAYFYDHFVNTGAEAMVPTLASNLRLYDLLRILNPMFIRRLAVLHLPDDVAGFEGHVEASLAKILEHTMFKSVGRHKFMGVFGVSYLRSAALTAELRAELYVYRGQAELHPPEVDALDEWWRGRAASLPAWAMLVRRAMIIRTSSAPVERVFSMLRYRLRSNQARASQQSVTASLQMALRHEFSFDDVGRKRGRKRRLDAVDADGSDEGGPSPPPSPAADAGDDGD
jgi:hypothetical protein